MAKRGPRGRRGAVRATGPSGKRGTQGEQGKPGKSGKQGARGVRGRTGLTGLIGPIGPPGIPMRTEYVARIVEEQLTSIRRVLTLHIRRTDQIQAHLDVLESALIELQAKLNDRKP